VDYRLDSRTGWWERDDGACHCIYFDRSRTLIETGDFIFVRYEQRGRTYFLLDRLDTPTEYGVRGYCGSRYLWEDIISVKAFHGLNNIGIYRWRHRLFSKNLDCLGQFLSMKEWTRLRKICAIDVDGIWTLAELSSHWLTVTFLYTKEQQLLYDEAYADTIEYLTIGMRVRPAMDRAPHDISSCGWLFAMIDHPAYPRACGWIHPGIVGLRLVDY